MKYIETYKIDIGKNFYNYIKVKQNDTARYIRFEIFQNSIPFDLKGKNVRIYGIKPDKKILWNGCTLEDETNGKILVPITSQMTAVPGILKAELTIIEGDDILSSIPFEIKVIPCVRNDKAVESTNEFKDVFSTKITTVEVVDGVLQLTKDKYQIAEVPSGTEIRTPESIRADEYTNINLIINAKENKFFVFDDIKWKEKPNLQAGYDYVISFTCINNIWYGEWLEYREFEKSYLYKNGDECSAVTGGWDVWYRVDWNYGDASPWQTGKVDPVEGEKTEQYISCIGEDGPGNNFGFYRWVQTANELDLTNFNNLYVDFSIESTGYGPVKLRIGDKLLINSSVVTERNIAKFDISDITTGRVKFGNTDGQHYNYNCALMRIYKMWLE